MTGQNEARNNALGAFPFLHHGWNHRGRFAFKIGEWTMMMIQGGNVVRHIDAFALPYFRAYRDSIIDDVLLGFADVEKRADQLADAVFERLGEQSASEDYDGDMSGEAEVAQDQGQAYYETMMGIRQATINLLATGLFHLLEQQLANVCRGALRGDVGDGKLRDVAAWFKDHCDLDLKSLPEWPIIDELHVLANTVKHGEGWSADKLRELRPSLFQHPCLGLDGVVLPPDRRRLQIPLAGSDLFVSEDLFREYAGATTDFMTGVAAFFHANAHQWFPRSGG